MFIAKPKQKLINKFLVVAILLGLMLNFTTTHAFAVVTNSFITLDSGFNFALGLTLVNDNDLYYSDYGGDSVRKTDINGSTITNLGNAFYRHMGIAVDSNGDVYVADYGHSKLKKIAPDKTVTDIPGSFAEPIAIHIGSDGLLYVVCFKDGSIIKLNKDGSNVTPVVSGLMPYNLTSMTMDSSNNIYVSGRNGLGIKKIDTHGAVTDFSTSFTSPNWIDLGSDGYFYVTELNQNIIKKVDNAGHVVATFSTGSYQPWGVTADRSGYIYFTTQSGNLIKYVGNASTIDPTHIMLTMNYNLLGAAADPIAFTISGAASNPTVTSVVISGKNITLTLSSPIVSDDRNIKLNYSKTGNLNLSNGVELSNFVNLPIVNNIISVSSVASLPTINVINGTSQAAITFPNSVYVTLSNSVLTQSLITWIGSTPAYDGNKAGTYTFTGNFTLLPGVQNDKNLKASVAVVVDPATISSVASIPSIDVPYGTLITGVSLPNSVEVTLNSGTTTTAAISWNGVTPAFNGNSAGTYKFSGTLVLPFGVLNPLNKTAEVNVVVGSISNITPTSASFDKYLPNQANININTAISGTTLSSITCGSNTLSSGVDYTIGSSSITINSSYLSTQNVGNTVLNFNFTNGDIEHLNLSIIDSTPILSTVPSIHTISVPYGTDRSGFTLPSNLTLTLNNGATTTAAISWNNGTPAFNGNSAGTYKFLGTLALPFGVLNPLNKTAEVNVIVGSISSLTPTSASFDKYLPNQTNIKINMVISGTTLSSITNGSNTLIKDVDYTITGSTVTINSSYLSKQSLGSALINFNFANGDTEHLNLSLIDSAPVTPIIPTPPVPTPIPSTDDNDTDDSKASQSTAEVRTVNVVPGDGTNKMAAVPVQIIRTLENGLKIDRVQLNEAKTSEIIKNALQNKQDMATILVTDLKDNKADKLEIEISRASCDMLSANKIGIRIDSETFKLELPMESLANLGKDIKISVREVKEESKRNKTKALAATLTLGTEVTGPSIEIETNYSGRTMITIPLANVPLPKDEAELKKVLSSLGVLVEHSDGENLIDKGEIKYDSKGTPAGISIWVDKFSTFTIVSVPNIASIPTSKEIPQIKFVGLGHSPLVEGDKEDFIISSGFNGNVQYRIYLEVNNSWQEVTNGYSSTVNGKEAFSITPDYKFEKGIYKGKVYVKQAGQKGSKEENGIDYDNYYVYNINCVDRDDANRVYTNGELNIVTASLVTTNSSINVTTNNKVVISGIDGINGIPGPYLYRLHIYDVEKDAWTNNVVPYSSKLEWTPNKAGTYVLDVHVITPNSSLWSNIQNDDSTIYGGYEGWRLKTIKVTDK